MTSAERQRRSRAKRRASGVPFDLAAFVVSDEDLARLSIDLEAEMERQRVAVDVFLARLRSDADQ